MNPAIPQLRRNFAWALRHVQRALSDFDAILHPDPTARGPFNRNYAFVRRGDTVVHIAPEVESLSRDRQRAILLHEIGHILVDGGWADVDARWPHIAGLLEEEQLADVAVEVVTGITIRYDDDLMQTLGEGTLRPTGLR